MERYSEYKDSGISWMSLVPSHWDEKRLASIFTSKPDANSDFKYKCAYKFFYGKIVLKNETGNLEEYRDNYKKYSIVKKDDIMINGLNLNYDFVSQRVAIVPEDGIITSAYLVMRPKNTIIPMYYCYLFKAMDAMKMFHGMGTGIRLTLSFQEIKKYLVPLPPLSEQKTIVAYLDNHTSRIDSFIADVEREIELLGEAKQKIIADAVTKGLKKDVEMKDSGIRWCKKIPSHWKVQRAKYLFKKENREVRPEDKVVTCFRDGQVTLRENRRTTGFTEAIKENGYQGIRKGDLVIHKMDAFAGSTGVSDSDGKGTPVYHCCTPRVDYVYNYYYAHVVRWMGLNGYIQSLYRGIRERSSDFGFDVFGRQFLPIPPIEEQQEIVDYISQKTSQIDTLISSLTQQITSLKEYKQRLISDVVTGQINVQNIDKNKNS